MRITVDGERKEISTKVDCPRELWNQKSGRATSNKPPAKQLNYYLDSLSMKVLQARQALLSNRNTERMTSRSGNSIMNSFPITSFGLRPFASAVTKRRSSTWPTWKRSCCYVSKMDAVRNEGTFSQASSVLTCACPHPNIVFWSLKLTSISHLQRYAYRSVTMSNSGSVQMR